MFSNCKQNDVTSQRFSLSVEFGKPRPILLSYVLCIPFDDLDMTDHLNVEHRNVGFLDVSGFGASRIRIVTVFAIHCTIHDLNVIFKFITKIIFNNEKLNLSHYQIYIL